jgi:hypothetical protein
MAQAVWKVEYPLVNFFVVVRKTKDEQFLQGHCSAREIVLLRCLRLDG